MHIYSYFVYNGKPLYVVLEDITQYQKLYFKDNSKYSLDFVKYDYLVKMVEYLYEQIPQLKLIDCEVENLSANLDGFTQMECQFIEFISISLFVPCDISDKIFYYLNRENYNKLFRNYSNDIDNGCCGDDLVNFKQKISFSLIHGEVLLNSMELQNLQLGDILMLDNVFAPNSCKVNFENEQLTFLIDNNQLIFE